MQTLGKVRGSGIGKTQRLENVPQRIDTDPAVMSSTSTHSSTTPARARDRGGRRRSCRPIDEDDRRRGVQCAALSTSSRALVRREDQLATRRCERTSLAPEIGRNGEHGAVAQSPARHDGSGTAGHRIEGTRSLKSLYQDLGA